MTRLNPPSGLPSSLRQIRARARASEYDPRHRPIAIGFILTLCYLARLVLITLHRLIVTIALMFWGWLWGGMGLILALPLTGALKIVFDNIESLRPYGDWLGESATKG